MKQLIAFLQMSKIPGALWAASIYSVETIKLPLSGMFQQVVGSKVRRFCKFMSHLCQIRFRNSATCKTAKSAVIKKTLERASPMRPINAISAVHAAESGPCRKFRGARAGGVTWEGRAHRHEFNVRPSPEDFYAGNTMKHFWKSTVYARYSDPVSRRKFKKT
jgi:hypothetical protein